MKITYVNVACSDFDRAVAFYEGTLGLTLNFADRDFGYASFDAGPIALGVAKSDDASGVGGHTGIGFVVDDVDAEYARLSGAGVRFTMKPERQPWGGYMGLFADPDGNVFYLDQVRDR
jgi:predicted enzyme related to lactoylglutathione lyase